MERSIATRQSIREAAKSTNDGSPRPDKSGLAMTNIRHFFLETPIGDVSLLIYPDFRMTSIKMEFKIFLVLLDFCGKLYKVHDRPVSQNTVDERHMRQDMKKTN
jgi:hypothetical protein